MTNPELFVQHLDSVTGRSEDVIRQVKSSDPKLPHVAVFIYKDWPEAGLSPASPLACPPLTILIGSSASQS